MMPSPKVTVPVVTVGASTSNTVLAAISNLDRKFSKGLTLLGSKITASPEGINTNLIAIQNTINQTKEGNLSRHDELRKIAKKAIPLGVWLLASGGSLGSVAVLGLVPWLLRSGRIGRITGAVAKGVLDQHVSPRSSNTGGNTVAPSPQVSAPPKNESPETIKPAKQHIIGPDTQYQSQVVEVPEGNKFERAYWEALKEAGANWPGEKNVLTWMNSQIDQKLGRSVGGKTI